MHIASVDDDAVQNGSIDFNNIPPPSRPIIFVHGMSGHANEFDGIMSLMRNKYGSNSPTMHSIGICEGSCSLHTPLTKQRDDMLEYLTENAASLGIDGTDEGFDIVAHSQGALVMRAVIQRLPPSLKVHTYVSMAGPQRGQWGQCNNSKTGIGPRIAEKMARPVGWIAFYNPVAQRELSFANYWNDPRHGHLFRRESNLLAEINGYKVDDEDGASSMAEQKANFLRVEKAVFLGSSDDDCINPPLSSVFHFVDNDGNSIPMESSVEYSRDTFGLRTMDEEGRLVVRAYSGYDHQEGLRVHDGNSTKKSLFELAVLPHFL